MTARLRCTSCGLALTGHFVTLPCGHPHHEACARATPDAPRCECAECGDSHRWAEAWPTYWQDARPDTSDDAIAPAPTRKLLNRHHELQDCAHANAERAAALEAAAERADGLDAQEATVDAELRKARAALAGARERSAKAEVAKGAAKCFRALEDAKGETQIEALLRALVVQHAAAASLPQLAAVQRQLLARLQQQ